MVHAQYSRLSQPIPFFDEAATNVHFGNPAISAAYTWVSNYVHANYPIQSTTTPVLPDPIERQETVWRWSELGNNNALHISEQNHLLK